MLLYHTKIEFSRLFLTVSGLKIALCKSIMSDIKQVKVDNWGIFFLQRLKHFFNRTDYCDLTLQFQDNAQLKVHRLVLNACTEYFEILERTCEMYEDCLIMPDDLQTDVMVPIVNFMYTGQLEYKNDMLEKLYQTSQIMNMSVLTKLLDAQRSQARESNKQQINKNYSHPKRSYTKAFNSKGHQSPQKKVYIPAKNSTSVSTHVNTKVNRTSVPIISTVPQTSFSSTRLKKKPPAFDNRPTRYDLPEELDTDNIFENSFANISYDSKPLMVHPETKQYSRKSSYGIFSEASSSKFENLQTLQKGSKSSMEIVECKQISRRKSDIFEEGMDYITGTDIFEANTSGVQTKSHKDSSQLFDQILDNSPKLTIETKDLKRGSNNLDHAKIISEVLKKYPHLVKSNKNIRLKILDASPKVSMSQKASIKKHQLRSEKEQISREPTMDYTYESDVIDSKEAGRLIAMGAENVKGPWICLICGTPGRALHFTSYYKFRCHLVDVHNEKPITNICEYCGFKSAKRNYLLHHMYTKHDIEPPPQYSFPKCNLCNYVGVTESFLVKHKMTHSESREFRCNVCYTSFKSSNLLLKHIQVTGHKICADRKTNLQCIYCLKVFLREGNLYAHIKANHKTEAKNDGIVDYSDDEEEETAPVIQKLSTPLKVPVKYEPITYDNESSNIQYQIQQCSDGDIQVLTKKTPRTPKQKILNQEFPDNSSKIIVSRNLNTEFIDSEEMETETLEGDETEEIILHENAYILKQDKIRNEQYILPEIIDQSSLSSDIQISQHTVSSEFNEHVNNQQAIIQQPKAIIKKTGNVHQPIEIVVSNEEEYKALMASNPSIIFDENNPGKTLTVLTTPHNSALNTATIDLNNPQTSEMMIIQENYPITVSEAVPTDGSNIVVVYSHPVEHNKQYLMNAQYTQPQLMSSEGIEAQFVPSSAVITQNYEAIATTTALGQVIVQQPVQSWQSNNIQQNVVNETVQITNNQQYNIGINEQTQLIHNVSEINTNPTREDNALADLPDINITQEQASLQIQPEPVHSDIQEQAHQEIQEVHEEVHGGVQEEIHEEIQEEVQETVQEEVHGEIADQEVVDNSIMVSSTENPILNSEVILESNETNNITSNTTSDEISTIITNEEIPLMENSNENVIETQENTQVPEEEQVVENATCISDDNIKIPETNTQSNETQNIEEPVDHVENKTANNENTIGKNNKNIEILTLEWSEDEDEHATQQSQENENADIEKPLCDIPMEQDATEIEESIENIQQEMEKQMTTVSSENVLADSIADVTKNEETNGLQPQVAPETVNHKGNDKLTSLLNDWDEIESQAESSTSQNEIEIPIDTEGTEHQKVQDSQPETIAEQKEATITPTENVKSDKDNIKKLVSDWDDDEE